eukprot:TRINITY_DN2349_c1_g1_i13.p2 TRINITY_DN2349_c1_g1~~TRINITY_DN2349_c1_g1_i13.p2  ORF type:complete len:222 (-),score=11.31 TRINITY_DN2349_c1_g1_i13:1245-1886(-)
MQHLDKVDWAKFQEDTKKIVGQLCYNATDPYFVFGLLGGLSTGLLLGYTFWARRRVKKTHKQSRGLDEHLLSQQLSGLRKQNSFSNQSEVSSYLVDDKTEDSNLRLLFVVRTDSPVSKGQVAAWISHAAILLFRKLQKKHSTLLKQWLEAGTPKVSLRANSEDELQNIKDQAAERGIPFCVINGSNGAGRMLVAVGPGPQAILQQFTGHLKLL